MLPLPDERGFTSSFVSHNAFDVIHTNMLTFGCRELFNLIQKPISDWLSTGYV